MATMNDVQPFPAKHGKVFVPTNPHPVAYAFLCRKREEKLFKMMVEKSKVCFDMKLKHEEATKKTKIILQQTDIKKKKAELHEHLNYIKSINDHWDRVRNSSLLLICLMDLEEIYVDTYMAMAHTKNCFRAIEKLWKENPPGCDIYKSCPMCQNNLFENKNCPMCQKSLALHREFGYIKSEYDECQSRQLELSQKARDYLRMEPDSDTFHFAISNYVKCSKCIRSFNVRDTICHGHFHEIKTDATVPVEDIEADRLARMSLTDIEHKGDTGVYYCNECYHSKRFGPFREETVADSSNEGENNVGSSNESSNNKQPKFATTGKKRRKKKKKKKKKNVLLKSAIDSTFPSGSDAKVEDKPSPGEGKSTAAPTEATIEKVYFDFDSFKQDMWKIGTMISLDEMMEEK